MKNRVQIQNRRKYSICNKTTKSLLLGRTWKKIFICFNLWQWHSNFIKWFPKISIVWYFRNRLNRFESYWHVLITCSTCFQQNVLINRCEILENHVGCDNQWLILSCGHKMFMYFRFNANSSGHSNLIVASGTDIVLPTCISAWTSNTCVVYTVCIFKILHKIKTLPRKLCSVDTSLNLCILLKSLISKQKRGVVLSWNSNLYIYSTYPLENIVQGD